MVHSLGLQKIQSDKETVTIHILPNLGHLHFDNAFEEKLRTFKIVMKSWENDDEESCRVFGCIRQMWKSFPSVPVPTETLHEPEVGGEAGKDRTNPKGVLIKNALSRIWKDIVKLFKHGILDLWFFSITLSLFFWNIIFVLFPFNFKKRLFPL